MVRMAVFNVAPIAAIVCVLPLFLFSKAPAHMSWTASPSPFSGMTTHRYLVLSSVPVCLFFDDLCPKTLNIFCLTEPLIVFLTFGTKKVPIPSSLANYY
jgi:hypothetical protein